MNNAAIIVKINSIRPHPNADNLVIVDLFGTQVITSKDIQQGELMAYYDSNLRLSPEYLRSNNLYRHSELNSDPTKTGYFDDNGRVKAIKLRGEFSDGVLLSLYSFKDFEPNKGKREAYFVQGLEFTEYNGTSICEKYVPLIPKGTKIPGEKNSKTSISSVMFKEHYDTGQFFKEQYKIAPGLIYIIEKTHGTSGRIGHVIVDTEKEISKWKANLIRFITRLFTRGSATFYSYRYIHGSRRVVYMDRTIEGFHDNTMREEIFNSVKGMLQKGKELYFEIYGYEKSGREIQKGFPYGCKPGEYKAKLYRVTMNNEDGELVDYSLGYVINKAKELGMEYPHIFETYYYDGTEESMKILEQKVIQHAQGQSVLDPNTLKEGVIVQFLNQRGLWDCLKYKSDAFRLKESGDRDKGIIDQEDIN